MPRRKDLQKILMIGSGPIVIGQACEFDYSGTQALKALKEEGYQVILINSNPATIMTDPEFAHRVYIEPLTVPFIEKVIERERPQALLPTMGGQTALNLTMALHEAGILKKWNVEILGAKPDVIHRAEDRDAFKQAMSEIGVECARSSSVHSLDEGRTLLKSMGLPLILRPSFTLGGEGGGACFTEEDFLSRLERALFLSPTRSVLVEESLLGWKEFELEVVRDRNDNVVIVCSIENFDPMGVHTGDSITVAPAQTLTDREYQHLRDLSIRIIRKIGVETGGSNIQFSIHPSNGRVICIEMNPRVSRSSALASKATGFPIARVAAKLAVGYTLDELTNDITQSTPCSFEPSIDYIVTKIPRFDFEKFRPTPPWLGTQMKSVGEVMAMGHTFEESLGKALAGLEIGSPWFAPYSTEHVHWEWIERPSPKRLRAIADALRLGISPLEIAQRSGIERWFLDRVQLMIDAEKPLLQKQPVSKLTRDQWQRLKQTGWSDRAIAERLDSTEAEVREVRTQLGLHAAFHQVDTCAAEFEAKTPYLYSSYFGEDESGSLDASHPKPEKKKVMILGGGPNRIGQGIEFDYCCVHAALALREAGYQTIMVNSNPETVSTDFDTSDRLYFEPLTPEHVLNIARVEKPLGVIVQLGGQTPLKIARSLEQGGLPILGTSIESIDIAEDRKKCDLVVRELRSKGLHQPPATLASTREEAIEKARVLGYPVLIRPSYVLGGKGMRIVHSEASFKLFIDEAIQLSDHHPVLIDRFLDRATEVDVDALSDGEQVLVAGLMEHIEEAGIHSGDSACSLPPVSLKPNVLDRIRFLTRELAERLKVIGLINVQFAVQNDDVYLLEVNPRASRTVPFVSKAVGHPIAKIAARLMVGESLRSMGFTEDFDLKLKTFSVKAPVFPFHKFPEVDVLLGPEMKSTGEVMGRAGSFGGAYAKAMAGAGMPLPSSGKVFLSIRNEDKVEVAPIANDLITLGFEIWATQGTAHALQTRGMKVQVINKVVQGSPHCVEAIQAGQFDLIINTTSDEQAIRDSFSIRRAALERKIPYSTVLSAARAMVGGIREQRKGLLGVEPL